MQLLMEILGLFHNTPICAVCHMTGMLRGWWKVESMDELRMLANALHSRGVRERALQKQIQKHMEFIGQAFTRNGDSES